MRAGQGEGEEVGSVVASGRVLFSDGSGGRRLDSVASSQLACFFKTINAFVSGKGGVTTNTPQSLHLHIPAPIRTLLHVQVVGVHRQVHQLRDGLAAHGTLVRL